MFILRFKYRLTLLRFYKLSSEEIAECILILNDLPLTVT